nr:rhodanese-like domain-containing protein [Corallococcus exiguus]
MTACASPQSPETKAASPASEPAPPKPVAAITIPRAPPPPPPGDVYVDAAWVQERLARGAVVALDARPGARYAEGHLAGAVRLEGVTEVEGLRRELAGAGLCQGPVVLYGEAGSGPALARMFALLEAAGLADVYVLRGGVAAWREQGLPLVKQTPASRSCEWKAPGHEVLVSRDAMMDAFGQRGIEVLDLRDHGWEGNYDAPAHFRAGHIPFALPFDLTRFGDVAADAVRLDDVRTAVTQLGPRKNDTVPITSTFILHGDGPEDPRPLEGYLLMRAAGLKARIYSEGWQGWTPAPVVRVVEAEEVARLMEPGPGATPEAHPMLLDLREPWDFRLAYLPGSQSLALRLMLKGDTFESFVQQHWPQADRAKTPLIFVCYGHSCVRSREAAVFAARKGFTHLLWYREGVDGWRAKGLPLLNLPRDGATP